MCVFSECGTPSSTHSKKRKDDGEQGPDEHDAPDQACEVLTPKSDELSRESACDGPD